MRLLVTLLVAGSIIAGCTSRPSASRDLPVLVEGWRSWQVKRHESIAGSNGWTTLISRHWLKEGNNFVGADPTNDLVLPAGRAASTVGNFFRTGRNVRFTAARGVTALIEDKPVVAMDMVTDADGGPSRLAIGPLSVVVIERGERLGLRVRDPEAPSRLAFQGLHYFPYRREWRLEGRFDRFDPVRTLQVADASGGSQELPCPGAVVFLHRGVEYRLEVAQEPKEEQYFVIFKDRSAGGKTYAAGRFLYVDKPDSEGHVVIDFNRAYTPPCGFTPYATCPMPPPQNRLPFAIHAGELKPHGH